MNISQIALMLFTLIGFGVPFLHVAHARHARAFMSALVGLTALWTVGYELARLQHALGPQTTDRLEVVLLRGYLFSAALCSLLEEILSLRDQKKAIRPVSLILSSLFVLLALATFALGMFGASR